MEGIVLTLPAKPKVHNNDIRSKISPTLVDFIGDGLQYKKGLAMNLLNTYDNKEQYFDSYIKQLKQEQLINDYIFTDKNYIEKIIEIIYKMIDEKIIVESNTDLIRCDCGKVDLLKFAVHQNVDGTLYKFENEKIICKSCNKECKESKESILKIDVNKSKIKNISIVPSYFNNVINGIIKDMDGSFILISKKRNTGCIINYQGKEYNIDIDFIWSLLTLVINADKKILVGGNRQILKMFIINYINSLMTKQDLTFVAHPYIYFDEQNKYNSVITEDDIIMQKLEILYNLKWKNNNGVFNDSFCRCIKNYSIQDKYKLFSYMLSYFDKIDKGLPFEIYLEKVLNSSANFQKNLKILKR